MTARIASLSIIAIALCLAIGCSKSSTTQASLESSSNLASSPFKSSSKSSAGEDETADQEETSYQRDVRHYTVAFARSGGELDVESFQRDLSEIAEGYGISDWEQTGETYLAIGRGLGESGLDDASVKRLAVALANQDYDHLARVRSGYESRRAR